MIKLNSDESMLVLITKGWEARIYPYINKDMEKFTLEYIQGVCNKRCNMTPGYNADILSIYTVLVGKLVNMNDLLNILNDSRIRREKSYYKIITEMFIQAIVDLKCDGVIEFDYNEVVVK